MGKGGGDPTNNYCGYRGFGFTHRVYCRTRSGRKVEVYWVLSAIGRAEFGGNVTTGAANGSQFPPDSSASRSQNPAGSSVVVEEGRRLADKPWELAKLGLPIPDSVVVEEVPKFSGQATGLTTSGVPKPDSEALGCLNEGSEKALVVQLHRALHGLEELDRSAGVFHGVTPTFIAVLLRCVRSLDYNLRQQLCKYILRNGEKAGKSSSKGNLTESSDAPYAKRQKLAGCNNFPGVRKRNNSFSSEIRLPGMKNKFWLGTYKTAEAAAQARGAAANWLATHSGSKLLNDEERDELKKCAKKAGEHLSDYRSHHNVASPDLATTLASLKGKAVASPEHVSQRESPAHENFSPELELSLLDNFFPESDLSFLDNFFRF